MNLLRPKIILSIAGAGLVFILVSLAQELNRRWQYQREVEQLKQTVYKSEQQLTELANLNTYFKTEEYKERLAREKLNYRAPGEKVILIPQDTTQSVAAEAEQSPATASYSIARRWWNAFFDPTGGQL